MGTDFYLPLEMHKEIDKKPVNTLLHQPVACLEENGGVRMGYFYFQKKKSLAREN